jgi:hypothetical protein
LKTLKGFFVGSSQAGGATQEAKRHERSPREPAVRTDQGWGADPQSYGGTW